MTTRLSKNARPGIPITGSGGSFGNAGSGQEVVSKVNVLHEDARSRIQKTSRENAVQTQNHSPLNKHARFGILIRSPPDEADPLETVTAAAGETSPPTRPPPRARSQSQEAVSKVRVPH